MLRKYKKKQKGHQISNSGFPTYIGILGKKIVGYLRNNLVRTYWVHTLRIITNSIIIGLFLQIMMP